MSIEDTDPLILRLNARLDDMQLINQQRVGDLEGIEIRLEGSFVRVLLTLNGLKKEVNEVKMTMDERLFWVIQMLEVLLRERGIEPPQR